MTYTVVLATQSGIVYATVHNLSAEAALALATHRLATGRRVELFPESCEDQEAQS